MVGDLTNPAALSIEIGTQGRTFLAVVFIDLYASVHQVVNALYVSTHGLDFLTDFGKLLLHVPK